MNVIQIAKTCHEVNRAYCKSIGDNSQPSWENAPDWQKDSAINGVKFHLDNPNAGPSASHVSWLKEKVDSGWVYGDVKDPEAKTHPCIVDYDDLPDNQKAKDSLFISVVHSFKNNLINNDLHVNDGIRANGNTTRLVDHLIQTLFVNGHILVNKYFHYNNRDLDRTFGIIMCRLKEEHRHVPLSVNKGKWEIRIPEQFITKR